MIWFCQTSVAMLLFPGLVIWEKQLTHLCRKSLVEIIFGATRIFPMMISDSFRVDKVLQFCKALGPRLKKPRLNIHRECLRYDCKFAVSD